MQCRRVDALLPAYLDGDLAGRLNGRVSEHLEACERCRRELAAQQQSLRALDLGRHSVSIDLWADFSRRLQAEAPPRPALWRLFWQPALALSLAAVIVAFVALSAPRPAPAPAFRPEPVAAVPGAEPARRSRTLAALPPLTVGSRVPSVSRRAALEWQISPSFRRTKRERLASRSLVRRWRSGRHHRFEPAGSNSETPAWLTMATRPERPAVVQEVRFKESQSHSRPTAAPSDRGSVAAAGEPGVYAPGAKPARAAVPLRIAEALSTVEADAASAQMKGELLRLASEVARVGGEASGSQTGTSGSDAAPGDATAASSPDPAGG